MEGRSALRRLATSLKPAASKAAAAGPWTRESLRAEGADPQRFCLGQPAPVPLWTQSPNPGRAVSPLSGEEAGLKEPPGLKPPSSSNFVQFNQLLSWHTLNSYI